MVNLKNPNQLMKNSILPPSLQDSSQCVDKSPDLSNLLSKAISRAGK